ncbi:MULTISPECIES: hypothetical protein [unclassified Gordonia (in: high G+C Gram-positive bacteria)]|uniref:hypothetical protein n=1 Tax=unclassified Gordonia (in: high G+C Gram-positive bacteria) TaxID=2657482 RepID=UPI0008154FD3|nr:MULTISPECIES: hypothetical protein [unclassified Gordonia (in: high G+C Gram-positive bacteria)]SCC02731.1 hypothetical protein GA0061091_104210 [Gordonia sp. v-85]
MRVHGLTAPARVRRVDADRPVQVRIGALLVSLSDHEALTLADDLVDAVEEQETQ